MRPKGRFHPLMLFQALKHDPHYTKIWQIGNSVFATTELMNVSVCCLCCLRQCATNQYLRKRDDPHRYCQDACADVTRCGPVIVPQHHLQVRKAHR